MFFIYILYSESSNRYYVGYTSDIKSRLVEHNEQLKFNTYTRKHRPWRLEALFRCGDDERVAIKLERFLKKQHSRTLIERLINPDFTPTGDLAELVRVPQMRD